MMAPTEARPQVYVYDPICTVSGPDELSRARTFAAILVLWAALGFQFSWRKGQHGHSVEWIGAEIQLTEQGDQGILVRRV